MKILFVNNHLEMGGIRQSLVNLFYNIKDMNLEIDLLLLKKTDLCNLDELENYNIKLLPDIHLISVYYQKFGTQKTLKDIILKIAMRISVIFIGRERTIKLLVNLSRKAGPYDIAVSYSNGIYRDNNYVGGCEYYVAHNVKAHRKIAWIHSNPEKLGFTYNICKRVYAPFNNIVNVSVGCKKIFDGIIPEFAYKSIVMHNLLNEKSICNSCICQQVAYDKKKFQIVTVARIKNDAKRIDRIIECCQMLIKKNILFEWHIIGEGPDKDMLEKLASKKKIESNLIFEGMKIPPFPYINEADLFVLTSDYEAFPMVLAESLFIGTPVVCTPIPPAKELVEHMKTGIISDFSIESIVDSISFLYYNKKILQNFRDNLRNNISFNDESLSRFCKLIFSEEI